MRHKTSWIIGLILIGLILISGLVIVGDPMVLAGRAPHITVSKNTTFITEPLKPDGSVDYVGAVNAKFSEGVTPENNAVVLVSQAVGAQVTYGRISNEFFALLGISPPPDNGKYFVQWSKFIESQKASHRPLLAELPGNETAVEPKTGGQARDPDEQFDKALQSPWSNEDHPLIAAWLAVNDEPLALIVEASQRPKYYEPLPDNEQMMANILLWMPDEIRNASKALIARAMLRAKSGEIDNAWDDLMACRRLARLVAQGSSLIHSLVGKSIEDSSCAAVHTMVNHARLSKDQIARFHAETIMLPSFTPIVEKLSFGERLFGLDCVVQMSRQGAGVLTFAEYPQSSDLLSRLQGRFMSAMVDWDEVLRLTNDWYDQIDTACRMPTRAGRDAALAAIDVKFKSFEQSQSSASLLLWIFSGRKERGETEGKSVICALTLTASAILGGEDRMLALQQLTGVVLLLAAYRTDRGKYPAALVELTPEYVADVAKDLFGGGDFIYHLQADGGYLLYSVGENKTDDGGRDRESDPDSEYDDLVVRAPAPPK